MKDSFTTQDVATILGITRVTVRNWVLKGYLKADTTKGGHRRINRGELERFLASRGVPLSLIREYELTKHKRFLFCWEYHNLGFFDDGSTGRKDCHNCLVYKCRAQKCHLVRSLALPVAADSGPEADSPSNCSDCGLASCLALPVAADTGPEADDPPNCSDRGLASCLALPVAADTGPEADGSPNCSACGYFNKYMNDADDQSQF